jgi:hypothetical protein
MVKRVVFGARYGLAGWLAQRVTAVVMGLYTVLFAFSGLAQRPFDYGTWRRAKLQAARRLQRIAERKVTFMNQSERSEQEKPAVTNKASALQLATAVFWGLFGVRRRRDQESDAARIAPVKRPRALRRKRAVAPATPWPPVHHRTPPTSRPWVRTARLANSLGRLIIRIVRSTK